MQELEPGIIQINSGILFDIQNPDPDAIRINDIGHALGNLCRWGGHARQFYSVAQHSFYASYLVKRPFAMAALLHDATEAYLVDIPRPLKALLPEYKRIEDNLSVHIAMAFDLPVNAFHLREVKHADDFLMAMEAVELLNNPDNVLVAIGGRPDRLIRDIDPNFQCWSPPLARERFLHRFRQIIAMADEGEMDS